MLATLYDLLLNRWRWIFVAIVTGSLVMAWLAKQIRVDEMVQPLYDTHSDSYKDYTEFVATFADEDILLIAVQSSHPVNRPESLAQLSNAKKSLLGLDGVLEIISLSDLIQPVSVDVEKMQDNADDPSIVFDTSVDIDWLRKIFPLTNRLVSADRLAAGFIVLLKPDVALGHGLDSLLSQMQKRLEVHLTDFHKPAIVGMPIVHMAVKKYTLQTAVSFGGLAILVGTLIAFYIFRSIRVTLVTTIVSGVALIWVLGCMVLFNIQVNTVTSLCFGFILVVATMITMHLVTQFFEAHRLSSDRESSLRIAVTTVLRPCFFCAVTTAVGFASFLLSPVSAIRQAGMVISSGTLFTFLLAFPLAVGMLRICRPPSQASLTVLTRDLSARVLFFLENMGLKQSGFTLALGCIFIVFMGMGLAGIEIDTYILDALNNDSEEKMQIKKVDRLMGLPDSISLIITAPESELRGPTLWDQLNTLNTKLNAIPQIKRIESPLPLMEYLQTHGLEIQEVFNYDIKNAKSPFAGYLDPASNAIRMALFIDHADPPNLVQLTRDIERIASDTMAAHLQITVTGQLGLAASQSVSLVRSQSRSLLFVLAVITILMILQLRSISLGLMSLVPNIFPLMTIFGCMGWLDIKLDPLTIFSVVISFGLSVDDTIHYLSHVKSALESEKTGDNLEHGLRHAFRITARALFSTTMVLSISCLALIFSPFQHIASLGLLIAAAALSAYWADVVFMPALILRFRPLQRQIYHAIASRSPNA